MEDTKVLVIAAAGALSTFIAVALTIALFALRRRWRREKLALQSTVDVAEARLRTLETKVAFYADRFRPVTSLDAEISRLNDEISALVSRITAAKDFEDRKMAEMRAEYASKRSTFDALLKQVAIFDDRLAFAEMGMYEPHFDFSDSEDYKAAIGRNRAEQKALISVKSAVLCLRDWTVDGSRAEGKKMMDRNIKLTLRAFNSECDAAVANCRWDNVNAMEKRIEAAQQRIDKLNEPNAIVITRELLALKLEELYLAHEYREKLKAEREERAEAARAAREEQKLQRDIERAEDEEARYTRLLNKAKADAQLAVGAQLTVFEEKIRISNAT